MRDELVLRSSKADLHVGVDAAPAEAEARLPDDNGASHGSLESPEQSVAFL